MKIRHIKIERFRGIRELEVFALQGMVGGRHRPSYFYSVASWSDTSLFTKTRSW